MGRAQTQSSLWGVEMTGDDEGEAGGKGGGEEGGGGGRDSGTRQTQTERQKLLALC